MKTIGVFILLYIQFYILSSVFYLKVTGARNDNVRKISVRKTI